MFDRGRLRKRRDRAAARFSDVDFLKRRACEDLAERLADMPRRFPLALDLGCHTGEAGQTLIAGGHVDHVIACDLSARMARLAGTRQGITALSADEEKLPFAPESFDLVVSVLSLHWVNDLPGTLIQIRRVLKPDGLFIAVLPGGESLQAMRRAIMEAELQVRSGAGARVSPFLDGLDAGRLLQRTGFAMPVSDTDTLRLRHDSLLGVLADVRGMGEAACLAGSPAPPLSAAILADAAARYSALTAQEPGGRVVTRIDLVWMSGWAPAPGQPVPKRPGSATVSLAQAVGARESSAGEKAGGGVAQG